MRIHKYAVYNKRTYRVEFILHADTRAGVKRKFNQYAKYGIVDKNIHGLAEQPVFVHLT